MLERTPNDINLRCYLAGLYLDQRDYEKADDAISRIKDSVPDYSGIYYLAAKKALVTGTELDFGIASVRKYLEREPQDFYCPCWAYTHLLPGIVSSGPEWAAACLLMGNLHEALGDRKQAKKDYEKALKYNPKLVQARDALDRL
jgi:tetratricopeptide (TPR) repeat protein